MLPSHPRLNQEVIGQTAFGEFYTTAAVQHSEPNVKYNLRHWKPKRNGGRKLDGHK